MEMTRLVPLDALKKFEAQSRLRRHRLLMSLIGTSGEPLSILDLGGTVSYWKHFEFGPQRSWRLLLLNKFPQEAEQPFETIVGDARDLSRFDDRTFDLVFSNSVIGHVGGFDDQERMAREIRRVGRHFFIQTPNHGFPLDWRTVMPLFHFLPAEAQVWCFKQMAVGTYKKADSAAQAREWATRVRNLRRRELSRLFPGATVVNEQVAGFTKSFMIHNFSAP